MTLVKWHKLSERPFLPLETEAQKTFLEVVTRITQSVHLRRCLREHLVQRQCFVPASPSFPHGSSSTLLQGFNPQSGSRSNQTVFCIKVIGWVMRYGKDHLRSASETALSFPHDQIVLSWTRWEAAELGFQGTYSSFLLECFPCYSSTIGSLPTFRHQNKCHHLQEALLDLPAKADLLVSFSYRLTCFLS